MQAGVRPDAVYLSLPDPGGRGRFALTGRRRIIRMRPATDSPPAHDGPGKAVIMHSVRNAVRRLVFAWLAVGLTASAAAAGPLLPCGVADPGGRTGFVANAARRARRRGPGHGRSAWTWTGRSGRPWR